MRRFPGYLLSSVLSTLSVAGCGSGDDTATGATPPGTSGSGGESGAGGSHATATGGAAGTAGSAGAHAGGSGGTKAQACVPGSTQTCVGEGACKGGQACLSDGSGWGACECSPGTGGSGGAAGSAGVSGGGAAGASAQGGVSASGASGASGEGGVSAGGASGASGQGGVSASGASGSSGEGGVSAGGASGAAGTGGSAAGGVAGSGGSAGSSVMSGPWFTPIATMSDGWPGSGNGGLGAVATDSEGNVYASGYLWGSYDGGMTTGQNPAIVVVKLDASGAITWLRTFETPQPSGAAIALDAGGNVVITGSYQGTIDFGAGGMTSTGNADIFVVSLEPVAGALRWAHSYGGTSVDEPTDLTVSPTGDITVLGLAGEIIDLGSGPITTPGMFAAFFDTNGASSKKTLAFGGSPACLLGRYASSGNLLLAGGVRQSAATFGAGGKAVTPASPGSGNSDIFFASIDASGNNVFTRHVTSTGANSASVCSLAITPDDGFVVSGNVLAGSDLGDGNATPNGNFLARYTATNTLGWATFPTTQLGSLQPLGAGVAATGDVFFAGYMTGKTDFGGGPISSGNADNAGFLLHMTSTGTYVDAEPYADSTFNALAMNPSSSPVVVGAFTDGANFGAGALSGIGALVATLPP